ncbi:DUF6011 domain-containing protein [Exiguobacterium sp. UBA5002]|uniref:DUF6011 domain-containing protein n=1 Tax=Exiguobacterium sp. UBA5002 TaxID=1946497 RepID=UPI0039C8589E
MVRSADVGSRRRLTTKESQREGIGPVCKEKWLRRQNDVGNQLQLALERSDTHES